VVYGLYSMADFLLNNKGIFMKTRMPLQPFAILLISVFIAGCATAYKPTQNVTSMLSTMSNAEAVETLQSFLAPHAQMMNDEDVEQRRRHGMCTDGVSMNGHALKVSNRSVAYKGYVSRHIPLDAKVERNPATAPGKIQVTSTYTSQLEDADFNLRFDQMKWIRLAEPGRMTWVCALAEGETEVKIQMTTSAMDWHAARILTKDKERFIASILKLAPEVEVRQ